METAKNISLIILISIIVTWFSDWLESEFLSKFLRENLVLILIALLAINITTISVIMTKLKEIYDNFGGDFQKTIKSLRTSIQEQVALLIFCVIMYVFYDSNIISNLFDFHAFLFDVLILTIFIYSLYILYDTANAIFVILDFEDNENNKD